MTGPSIAQPAPPSPLRNRWILLSLAAILLCTALIRIRLLPVPLERDEGEYAYAGQLILQGIPPYQLAYNMKLPGIYAVYALILALFGQSHIAIHLGLLLTNAATIVLVFLLARRLLADTIAIVAAAAFALLSLTQQIQGFTANAEPFVLLPALAGLLLLLHCFRSPRSLLLLTFFSGFLLGLAFLIKQHGILFLLFAAILLIVHHLQKKPRSLKSFTASLAVFTAAAILPFALTCLILLAAGVFKNFWFWTISYAREYVGMVSWQGGLYFFKQRFSDIARSALPFWIAAGIGLPALWIRSHPKKYLLTAFTLFSFAAVSIGFYYRPHYFILFLPAAALLAAYGIDSLARLLTIHAKPLLHLLSLPTLSLAAVLFTLYQQRMYLFADSPNQIVRTVYGSMPFPESLEIAKFIREHSAPADTIAVIGSEPQIYFYANRHAATGYIYAYPLMEEHPFALRMQLDMIRQIEQANPEFLLFVNIGASWQWRENSHTDIFAWFQNYSAKYDKVGVIDITYGSETVYRWNEDASRYATKSKNQLILYRKRKH